MDYVVRLWITYITVHHQDDHGGQFVDVKMRDVTVHHEHICGPCDEVTDERTSTIMVDHEVL